MGIEDEINRQNAEDQKKLDALFGIPSELDDTQKRSSPSLTDWKARAKTSFRIPGAGRPRRIARSGQALLRFGPRACLT